MIVRSYRQSSGEQSTVGRICEKGRFQAGDERVKGLWIFVDVPNVGMSLTAV